MAEQTQPLPGSHRDAPKGMRSTGRVPPDDPITVSLYFRPTSAAPKPAGGSMDRAALASGRGAEHAGDIAAIEAFAAASGLTVTAIDAGRRLINLSGTASAMEMAFKTELRRYERNGCQCRDRTGVLHVAASFADRIVAILGLDTRPIATPKIVPHHGPTPPPGFLPTDVVAIDSASSRPA